MLVRADNTTSAAYINRNGGTRSVKLHRLAVIVTYAHVPGVQNSGADLLSRGNPLYGEWRPSPEVLHRCGFGQVSIDLFA